MSRSVEDILLQVPHVKHKKNEGTLYLMGERLAWMASHKNDTFAVNHKYMDIKSQKISPDGKPKIQLQIVLHDGQCTTFHFNDPIGGRDLQIKQRDEVKELLQQLLPTFKRKMNKELEEKNRMLSENPALLQLYKDLVITNIITAEEFWSQHASPAGKSKSSANDAMSKSTQEVGVAGSFMSEIKPQADGANGIRYNLTADVIQSIFKTYPAVKRKHLENVPAKMTEQEFWTKFFQSHYFHRDRLHGKGVKDIFTECAKDDDKRMKEQIRAGVSDPLANLLTLSDKTIDESFGAADSNAGSNIVHQSIIKRFNQHSIMVMSAGQHDKTVPSSNSADPSTKADKTKEAVISEEEAQKNLEAKRKRIHAVTAYEDLEETPAKKPQPLNIARSDRYFIGPTPSGSTSDTQLSLAELNAWRQSVIQSATILKRDNCRNVLTARSAVSVLNDLSPGGALMKSSTQELLAEQQYPASVHQDLKQLYVSLAELLRHFWSCFSPLPPTTPQLQEKAKKMHETLRKFHMVKLRPFENELARQFSAGPNITMHINQMLESAYKKFETWRKNAGRHAIG